MVMKFVQLKDDAAGNTVGWKPGTVSGEPTFRFVIADPDVKDDSIIVASAKGFPCTVQVLGTGKFHVTCITFGGDAPPTGTALNYVILNGP